MPNLSELEAAAKRCARVEQNFTDPKDCSPITRVYEWDKTTPKGTTWDHDQRLIAAHALELIAQAREAERLQSENSRLLSQIEELRRG